MTRCSSCIPEVPTYQQEWRHLLERVASIALTGGPQISGNIAIAISAIGNDGLLLCEIKALSIVLPCALGQVLSRYVTILGSAHCLLLCLLWY
jgi:hypothetical protein